MAETQYSSVVDHISERGGKMAWKSLTTKVQDDFKEIVDKIAAKNGKTTSDFVRICIDDAVHGHYKLDGDHLVPTEEYLNALMPTEDDDIGLRRIKRMLEKYEYPESAQRRVVDQICDSISESGKYRSNRDAGCWGC